MRQIITMKKLFFIHFISATIILIAVNSCINKQAEPTFNGYPTDVGKIIFTKCATTGCHTDQSKNAAGGLSLSSWDNLFTGGRNSADVIPYRHDYSTLFSSINTFADLGVSNAPTMPYNKAHLTRDETLLIEKWIDAGAPDQNGFVKFSDNANRKKFYVTNQACDVVTVFDQQTLLPMRYITVGNTANTELPHNIKISPDGQYWYVISTAGNSLQKYRTSDDHFVGEAILGVRNWNTVTISKDGNTAYAVDWEGNGDIAQIDLNTFTVTHNNGFNFPHGSCLNPYGDTLYVTQNTNSNQLYKIPVSDFSSYSSINLYTTPPATPLNSHEVLFSPDGSEYFVTCQSITAPEVRIFKQGTDQLLAAIPVGILPSEMAISSAHNYLFVTCEEDTLTFPGKRGYVAVIDLANNTLKSKIYTGHQPHGIAVDDANNLVYVANRNATTGGPAPHHTGDCGGRDGYITFIDMNTLTLVKTGVNDKQVEVSVDPYSIAIRP